MRILHVPAIADERLSADTHPVKIDVRPFALEGRLVLPRAAKGAIVFGNNAPLARTQSPPAPVVATLYHAGFAVLLLDMLGPDDREPDEEMTTFETALLAARIVAASDWLATQHDLARRLIGCLAFGSAGSAAVVAATERPSLLRAVVVVDPRLDNAEAALPSLMSPLLMIVGKRDFVGSSSAQRAIHTVGGRQMQIRPIPGIAGDLSRARASEISRLACLWFDRYLR